MIATRSSPIVASELPRTVQAFVGEALEMVIHSVETLRDRLGKLAVMRRDAR